MRKPEHIIDIIFRLKKLWMENNDLRISQLVGNLHEDIYFIEDDVFIEKLEAFYNGENKKTKIKR